MQQGGGAGAVMENIPSKKVVSTAVAAAAAAASSAAGAGAGVAAEMTACGSVLVRVLPRRPCHRRLSPPTGRTRHTAGRRRRRYRRRRVVTRRRCFPMCVDGIVLRFFLVWCWFVSLRRVDICMCVYMCVVVYLMFLFLYLVLEIIHAVDVFFCRRRERR